MSRILLLGAGGPAGENFCRAVQMEGHEVTGYDPDHWALSLSSARQCGTRADLGGGFDYVHAQPDEEVRRLARYEHPQSLVPTYEAIQVAQDKLRTAIALGDLAPPSRAIGTPDDVREALDWLAGPVWFRARVGAGSAAALPVENVQLGRAWLAYWKARGVALMASRYLPGRNLSWTGVYSRSGELVASATKERIELLGAARAPSGTSSTARLQRIVYRPDVSAIAKQAIGRLTTEPRGVFMVDLREDDAGLPLVTEINAGRFGTTSLFFAQADGNLPAVLVALATGAEPPVTGEDCCLVGSTQVRNIDMGAVVIREEMVACA